MIEVTPPKVGEVWRHCKGGRYVIVAIAEGQGTGIEKKRLVVYSPLDDRTTFYVRPLGEWHVRHYLSHNHGMLSEPRFLREAQVDQPCSCMDPRHLTQGGYWDPRCLQHGVDSPGYQEGLERSKRERAEREDRPSQDLWGSMPGV